VTAEARHAATLLDKVLEAVRRSDYAAALDSARRIDLALLRPDRWFEMEEALEQVYLATSDSAPATGLSACETRLALSDLSLAERSDLVWRTSQAKAMHGMGYCLGSLQRPAEELTAYEAIIDHNKNAQELPLQERVAKALLNKGVTLRQLGRPDEALASYEELLGRFRDSEAPALQEPVAWALYNKGAILQNSGRGSEALPVYETLLQRFGASADPAICTVVDTALKNKGLIES